MRKQNVFPTYAVRALITSMFTPFALVLFWLKVTLSLAISVSIISCRSLNTRIQVTSILNNKLIVTGLLNSKLAVSKLVVIGKLKSKLVYIVLSQVGLCVSLDYLNSMTPTMLFKFYKY